MARRSREKSELLKILADSPNVSFACKKVGVARATFYRWIRDNKKFRQDAEVALELGRNQYIDIAEAALMKLIREGNFGAIKYFLSNNDPRYIQKRSVYMVPLGQKERQHYDYLLKQVANDPELTPEQKESIDRAINYVFAYRKNRPDLNQISGALPDDNDEPENNLDLS